MPGASHLLGLGLLFERLDLGALVANLALLRCEAGASLRLDHLVILKLVADHRAGNRSESAADRCAGPWMADRRANNRAGAGSQHATAEGSLFACR